jgi:hypothetical protein
LTTVAIAVISRDGILFDANRGFISLLPASMSAEDMLDVRDVFVNPRFDQFITRRAQAPEGVVYRGILNLGSIRESVCSLQGSLYALRDGVMMVAEYEVSGLELLRARLLQLGEELADERRKLASALREIKRHRTVFFGSFREGVGARSDPDADPA